VKKLFRIFKNKRFWLTVAHIGTAAGSIALAIAFPEIRPVILGSQALINGILPSPLNSQTTETAAKNN
jgi:hypothetical protein